MTLPGIISAAAHDGRIVTVTIRAESPEDCDARFAQLVAVLPEGAYRQMPRWCDNDFDGGGATSRWYAGCAGINGQIVSISTDHVPVERKEAA